MFFLTLIEHDNLLFVQTIGSGIGSGNGFGEEDGSGE